MAGQVIYLTKKKEKKGERKADFESVHVTQTKRYHVSWLDNYHLRLDCMIQAIDIFCMQ